MDVPFLARWPPGCGLRDVLEPVLAVRKHHYGLDTAYAANYRAALQITALILAAHRCGTPELRLSPARGLAHALPLDERP